jgi:hypothetical protein
MRSLPAHQSNHRAFFDPRRHHTQLSSARMGAKELSGALLQDGLQSSCGAILGVVLPGPPYGQPALRCSCPVARAQRRCAASNLLAESLGIVLCKG